MARFWPLLAGLALVSPVLAQPSDRPPAAPIPYGELVARERASAHPRAAAPAPADPAAIRPLASLPGWGAEDHLAALRAFQTGCGVERDAAWRAVCARAKALDVNDEASAKSFFETSFEAEGPAAAGLLTAYFSPEYPAQETPDEVFSAPVRGTPDMDEGPLTRAQIETTPADNALAFMKAEDLFFLQIQGSGTLVFPDGRRLRAVYAGDNGYPFTPIARPMVQAGLLPAGQASGDAIRSWLAAHRGGEADAVMDRNDRYIYFTLRPDDGLEPAGAAGTRLTPGRALAVDPSFHPYGALYWIDADAPSLKGAAPTYRRLALALDTGSAIKGERRADLYLGRGDEAGREAGKVRHVLNLVRLIPRPLDQTLAAQSRETSATSR